MILLATGLTKRYRMGAESVVGVEGIDLSIEPGEMVVVAGPSGSGKTTLLSVLGLLAKPDAGELRLEGRDARTLTERERSRVRRERIGFIFQSFHLIPVLTALENVAYALWIRDLPDGECRRRAEEALAEVGLAGLEGRRPEELSGGQRQRAAVARAIVGSPAVVLADEPTASLDSATAGAILDLFWRVKHQHGTTFVFSSHDPAIAERAGRRVHLRDGRVVSDSGAPASQGAR